MPGNRPASYADDVYFGWGSPCIMGIVVRINAGRGGVGRSLELSSLVVGVAGTTTTTTRVCIRGLCVLSVVAPELDPVTPASFEIQTFISQSERSVFKGNRPLG